MMLGFQDLFFTKDAKTELLCKYHAKDREGVEIERGPNCKMTGWNTPSCGGPLCNEDEKG